MKAFGMRRYGPAEEVVEEITLDRPHARGRDLLIKNFAASFNPLDVKMAKDVFGLKADLGKNPLVVGYDGCGVVEEVGDQATNFRVGDAVMYSGTIGRQGSFAEFSLVDETLVGRKPDNLSFAQAAALPLCALSAWEGLFEQLRIPFPSTPEQKAQNRNRSILIINGSGGMGSMLIQICHNIVGLNTICTAGREESMQWCKRLGADHVIDRNRPWKEQLDGLNLKDGVDYAFDCHDIDLHLQQLVDCIRPMGSVCAITFQNSKLDFRQFYMKRITLTLELMMTRPLLNLETEKQGRILNAIYNHVMKGDLVSTANVTVPFTLQGVKDGLRQSSSGKTIGKTVMTIHEGHAVRS